MRVRTNKTEPGTRFYIIKIYYDTKGIENTGTVKKPGSEQKIRKKKVVTLWNGQKNAPLS